MNSKNVTEAYLRTLSCLYKEGTEVHSTSEPTSVGSCFGKTERYTKEIIGHSIHVQNPADRAVQLEYKIFNIVYALAFSLWTLAGSDSLKFIEFFNGRGRQFSDDGSTLHGAHGKRLMKSFGIDQISKCIAKLKEHPYSRRAVASIHQVHDLISDSRDIPCLMSFQFLIRDNRLDLVTHMRSQSAYSVMPYDIFSFTFLQEAMAIAIGKTIGTYHHLSGSMHYYDNEENSVRELILKGALPGLSLAFPKMPNTTNPFLMAKEIMDWELGARNESDPQIPKEWPDYWREIAQILLVQHFSDIELKEQVIKSLDVNEAYLYHLNKYVISHEPQSV